MNGLRSLSKLFLEEQRVLLETIHACTRTQRSMAVQRHVNSQFGSVDWEAAQYPVLTLALRRLAVEP